MEINAPAKIVMLLLTMFSWQHSWAGTNLHYEVTPQISSQLELKILETLEDGDDYIFTLQYSNIACIDEAKGCLGVKFMNVVLRHDNQLVLSTPSVSFKLDEKLSFSNLKVSKRQIGNVTLEFGYGDKSSPIPSKVFSIKLNSNILGGK